MAITYSILKSSELYSGKGYGDWIADWFNWFLSVDPDSHNSGPVIFLRSFPSPQFNSLDSTDLGETHVMDGLMGKGKVRPYMNNPNIMVGAERLQIYQGQAVMFPVINAYYVATEPYADWGYMRSYTSPTIDHGEDPPDVKHVKVDNAPIVLNDSKGDKFGMEELRFATSVFTAVVPEAEYGDSLKDFLEIPIPAGNYPAIVEGYFILMKDIKLTGVTKESFQIHSKARGPRASRGPYFAELLYEIEVYPKDTRIHGEPTFSPARNDGLISTMLSDKVKKGEKINQKLLKMYNVVTPSKVTRAIGRSNKAKNSNIADNRSLEFEIEEKEKT